MIASAPGYPVAGGSIAPETGGRLWYGPPPLSERGSGSRGGAQEGFLAPGSPPLLGRAALRQANRMRSDAPIEPCHCIDRAREDGGMQVLTPAVPWRTPRSRALAIVGLLFGTALVAAGLALGYVFVAGPVAALTGVPARPTPVQTVVGILLWALILVAPALFVIAGIARMHGSFGRLLAPSGPRTPVAQQAARLPDDLVIATRVRLPDGRLIPELVIGPFGVAVVSELPPPQAVRRQDSHWEIRFEGGRWVPIQNPLDRAVRDTDHVRRWLVDDDRDFLVKVYTAAVTTGLDVERTPACAVLRPDQLPEWLAGLPPQRGLTPHRRERIIELIRERVGI